MWVYSYKDPHREYTTIACGLPKWVYLGSTPENTTGRQSKRLNIKARQQHFIRQAYMVWFGLHVYIHLNFHTELHVHIINIRAELKTKCIDVPPSLKLLLMNKIFTQT